MKVRADQLLFDKGLAESREKAKRIIMSGIVYIDDLRVDKPGTKIDSESELKLKGNTLKYVSRGGLKLEKAINKYNLKLDYLICMDIGASTGGFTDCMLQNGAEKVYSIDVGYGQLDWKLRNNEKVVNLEKTNFRYLDFEKIGEKIDFFTIDVSFISLKIIVPELEKFSKDNSKLVALIKPQFEAGREKVGKNGVVRDPNVHVEVIEKIIKVLNDYKWSVEDITHSPIKGPKGNIEFLAYCVKGGNQTSLKPEFAKNLVFEVNK